MYITLEVWHVPLGFRDLLAVLIVTGRSDENGAGPASGSLVCMGAGLGWWRERIRVNHDVCGC